jgi:hypothetical protein
MVRWGILFSFALGSCGKAKDDASSDRGSGSGGVVDSAPLPSFEEVRARWSAEGQQGIFSLSWQEYPEPLLFIHAGAYFGRGEDSCAVYEEDSYLERSSRYSSWFMQLYLSQVEPGTYEIRAQDAVGEPPVAQVLVYRSEKGELKERHTAIAGELEVSEAPTSTAEWHAGGGLHVRGRIEFSSEEDDQRQGCEIGSTSDGAPTVTCHCARADGTDYTCTQDDVGGPSCCIDVTAPRLTLDVDLTGAQCKALCDVVGGLSNRWCEKEL